MNAKRPASAGRRSLVLEYVLAAFGRYRLSPLGFGPLVPFLRVVSTEYYLDFLQPFLEGPRAIIA
jgi:hypothetical protein